MTPIKENKDKVLTTEREVTKKWKTHFGKVLSRPDSENQASPETRK